MTKNAVNNSDPKVTLNDFADLKEKPLTGIGLQRIERVILYEEHVNNSSSHDWSIRRVS
jgi:hypothetical protein